MACELNDDEFSIDSVAVEAWDDKSVDDRPMRHLSRDKEINANTGKAKEKKMCSRSYGTSRIPVESEISLFRELFEFYVNLLEIFLS